MICVIIQARMNSTRLPGKVLMEVLGKPVLMHVLERVEACKLVDKIIIATTDSSSDKLIVNLCKTDNIPCFVGNENDVLDRYYKAAKYFGLQREDSIVRITSDCPLIDPGIIDKVIELYTKENVNYVSNINPPTYPDGLDVEVFSFQALEKAWNEATLLSEREHVTPYITKHPEIFKQANLQNSIDLSFYRWTLDNKEDFEFIREIYHNLYYQHNCFCMSKIIEFLNANPKLVLINDKYKRNEGYKKSLKNDYNMENPIK